MKIIKMIQKIFILSSLILNCLYIAAQNDTTYYDTGQIKTIGKYENNQKHGEWSRFYKNRQLLSIESYENGKFKEEKFWNEKGDSVAINEVLVPPKYPKGGMNGFAKFISKNLKYPAIAAEKNIQGKVIVDFNINRNGELVDFKVYKSVHESLDNEAIRVIKKSRKWIPGTLHGEKVTVAMRFPINFQL